MGMDLTTHLGPYLLVNGKLTKTKTKVRRACPNHPKRTTDNKFCSTCGTAIESIEYEDVQTTTPRDFYYDNLDDKLNACGEEKNLFISNEHFPEEIRIDTNTNESAIELAEPILGGLADRQIAWFKKEYDNEIDAFVVAFGKDNVKIGWGFVSYWS